MMPAALASTTPADARSHPGRGGSDGSPQDDGFDAAFAQARPDATSANTAAAATTTTPAPTTPKLTPPPAQPDTGGIAALLAKLVNGAAPAPVAGEAAAAGKGGTIPNWKATGESTIGSDKAGEDSEPAAPAASDPVSTIAQFLPGFVATPMVASTGAGAAQAPGPPLDSTRLSLALGDSSLAKTLDASKTQRASLGGDATAAAAETGPSFTVVSSIASATHLAPVIAAAPISAAQTHAAAGTGEIAPDTSKATDEAEISPGFTVVSSITSATHLAPVTIAAPITAAQAFAAVRTTKTTPDTSKPTVQAELGTGPTVVSSAASAKPPAPVMAATRTAAAPGVPAAGTAATAFDAPKPASIAATGDSAAPGVSNEADAASHDAAPAAAVAARDQPATSLPSGTLQAIVGAVSSLAADAAPGSGAVSQSAPAAAVTDPTRPQTGPARSLTLQLSPENLGSVTVRLHLTEGGLDVNLAVDDRKTLAAISQASDQLAQAIGDNGYRVESLVIQGTDASSTSTAGSNDSARSQGQAGAGQGYSGGGAGGSGGDAPSSRQRSPQASLAARDSGGDRGNDGVFV